jgi:hypothetical protein
MMMDRNAMDALPRKWRDIRRMEVLERIRQALGAGGGGRNLASAGATSFNGGIGGASGVLGDSSVA